MNHKSLVLVSLLIVLASAQLPAADYDVTFVLAADASDCVRFGAQDLESALAAASIHVERGTIKSQPTTGLRLVACNAGTFTQIDWPMKKMGIELPQKADSFAVARRGRDVFIVGRDSTGTMYGLLELAERIRLDGAEALNIRKPIVQSPFLEFRAVNPFLTLPMPGDREWWFHSEEFWNGYLDLLARSRINWLDLHGMYNILTTRYANLLPYFTKSKKFHGVGVPPEEAKRNVAMLRKVIQMAHARGIKVALMNYHATWAIPSNPSPPHPQTESYLAEYTRKSVAELLRKIPELDMFGFRIGESGRKEDFYRESYLRGIAESGTHPELFTRSWGASREKVLDICHQYGGPVYLEIKYNGEHYGPPYQVAGGRMAGWRDYSYQDFLSYPRPYRVIWQVRVNGTHRAFRWGNPEWVARTVRTATLGDAAGISVEPLNAYYPMTDFMHKHRLKHDTIHWGYERDWFFYNLWGRLAYNPELDERVWISQFQDRFGEATGEHLYRAGVESSKIVPLGYTFHALGPDHRQHAPDLETGGDVRDWLNGQPFDTQVAQSVKEYVANRLSGKSSGKISPLDGAAMIEEASQDSLRELAAIPGADKLSGEAKCIAEDIRALAALGQYYSAKLRAATELGLLEATGIREHGEAAEEHVAKASAGWHELAEITGRHYQPFVENLRMDTLFHWNKEEAHLARDFKIIRKAKRRAKEGIHAERMVKESSDHRTAPQVALSDAKLVTLEPKLKRLTVAARVEPRASIDSVTLWYKPLPSESDWAAVPMKANPTGYIGSFDVHSAGAMYYLEALSSRGGKMYPDFRKDTPYFVIKPWDARSLVAESDATAKTSG